MDRWTKNHTDKWTDKHTDNGQATTHTDGQTGD